MVIFSLNSNCHCADLNYIKKHGQAAMEKRAHSLRRHYPDQVQRDFLSLLPIFSKDQRDMDGASTPGAGLSVLEITKNYIFFRQTEKKS